MVKKQPESDALGVQVMKAAGAKKPKFDRRKHKIKTAYNTRVLITYVDSDSTCAKFMSSALGRSDAATATKTKMRTTFRTLEALGKKGRWGALDPTTLTYKQFKSYIDSRIGRVSDRTVHNEASHIRRTLDTVGRGEFAQVTCSNKALGVPSASRRGTGLAIDLEVLKVALGKAREDTRAIILLEHAIGLRGREAIMCKDSLKEWKRAIAAGQPVRVRYGTKGGRFRSVFLCPRKAAEAAVAVDAALKVLEKQVNLVTSVNLKAALATNHRRLKKIGICGDDAQHGLRRSFGVTQFDYYNGELELPHKVALSRLAEDLGHGDKRGAMVFNCYVRPTLEARGMKREGA